MWLEIVPSEGLRLAFELAACGKSGRKIARDVNDVSHRRSGKSDQTALTRDSVRVILTNRCYIGDLPDGQGG